MEKEKYCKSGVAQVQMNDGAYESVMTFTIREGEKQLVACPEGYFGSVEVTCEANQLTAELAAQLAAQLDTQLTPELDAQLAALAGHLRLDGASCTKPLDMCDEMMNSCIGSPEFFGTPAPPCEDEKPKGWCRKVLSKALCDRPHGQKCKLSCDLC
jgi:hypothetical protein